LAIKRLQNFLPQRGVEVIGHDKLPSGQTDGAQLRQRRGRQDGETSNSYLGAQEFAFCALARTERCAGEPCIEGHGVKDAADKVNCPCNRP